MRLASNDIIIIKKPRPRSGLFRFCIWGLFMRLLLVRHNPGKDSTQGILFHEKAEYSHQFLGYTCEDEYRLVKVPGETRIPAGEYEIKFNTTGGMNVAYKKRYGDMHKGMLELQGVPGFSYVYMHTGNTEAHTDACILVGYGASSDSHKGGGEVSQSRLCYVHMYAEIARRLVKNEKVMIKITDSLIEREC